MCPKLNFIALLMLAATITGQVNASIVSERTDSLISDHKYIFFGNGENPSSDSITGLIYHFYYDQFRQFQDPAAPYFLFMSRDANLAMGIGGTVRMRGYYDWGGSVNAPAFAPIFIPTAPDPLHERLLGTTPAGTALFFRVIGRNKSNITYQLYIEANFSGYQSRDFKLKKAYAIVNDWTIGYAPSTFGDGNAVPPTIDSNGPTMKMTGTAVLVRWMHSFRNRFTVAASLETPEMTIQENGTTTSARSQYLPNIAAFLQYGWSHDEHVRLSAITRFLPYRDLVSERNHQIVGWGLNLSAIYHPLPQMTLYLSGNIGRSYSNYGGDMMLGYYDLVEDINRPGHLNSVPGYGYFVGIRYDFSHSVFASTTFAQGRYLPTADIPGSDYKYGLYSATNLFWNMTPRIMIGAEFNLGKRQNFDRTHGWARRIGAVAQFSF